MVMSPLDYIDDAHACLDENDVSGAEACKQEFLLQFNGGRMPADLQKQYDELCAAILKQRVTPAGTE